MALHFAVLGGFVHPSFFQVWSFGAASSNGHFGRPKSACWRSDSNRVYFFDSSLWPVPGYGRGVISWQTFEQVVRFVPAWLSFWGLCLVCVTDRPHPPPPAPHAMNVIPMLTKNAMGHDVSS